MIYLHLVEKLLKSISLLKRFFKIPLLKYISLSEF